MHLRGFNRLAMCMYSSPIPFYIAFHAEVVPVDNVGPYAYFRIRGQSGSLTLDTMVMDNDEALKRQGCDPTYKKVKGFQPLQLIWEGKIVDAIFRRGKRHSNYGNDVEKMIRGIVTLIRTRYNARADIVIRMDAGFFDEQNFRLCDQLGIGFIGTGKTFQAVKEQVAAIGEKEWKVYDNGRQKWSYAGFDYRCDKWENAYRALYTRPNYDGPQGLLE